MFEIRKILFPVDFSPQAERAAPYVHTMAKLYGAQVTMFHAVNPMNYFFGAGEFGTYNAAEFYREEKERIARQLDEFLPSMFASVPTERKLCEGEPGSAIAAFAHSNGFDVIMMPSHGMGPFRRFLLGSVTAKVLHDARVPVWTGVHLERIPTDPGMYRKVLCAIDLGDHSETVLRWAAEFAAKTNAALGIAHAVPAVQGMPEMYLDREFVAAIAHSARERIAALQGKLGTKAEVFVRAGDPATVVHEAAEEQQADLVVIARGAAAGGLGRLRGHDYSIIRKSPCPVVSV